MLPFGSGKWLRASELRYLFLLTVLVSAVYGNTLANSLHLDDAYRIANNPEVERFWPPWRHFCDPRTSATLPQLGGYRPLLPLSLSANNAISDGLGLDRLTGYHLGNIAIHLVTCWLVFALVLTLLRQREGSTGSSWSREKLAFGATLLFGIHPISGVPVNYISARDLLMATLLLTAAIVIYARMRLGRDRLSGGDSVAGWAGAVGCLGLSMAAKQNGVFFPALVLFFEALVMGNSLRSRGPWLRATVFAGPVAGFFYWTEVVLGFSDLKQVTSTTTAPVIYFLTQMKLHVVYYLRNFFWPFRMRQQPLLEESGGFADPLALLGLALVVATMVLAWRLRKKAPVAGWAILSYWVLFAPTSSFRPFYDLAVDYRQYPSLPFLCLLLALAVEAVWRAGRERAVVRRLVVAVAVAFVAYAGLSCFAMNRIWRTEETLWEHSVRYGASELGHLNYGHAIQLEDPPLAEKHYLEALRLAPNYVYAYINLGMLQIGQGRSGEGLANVRRAVEAAPEWAVSHHWMAAAYRQTGNLPLARTESRRAADLDPRNVEYQYEIAFELYQTGELADSLPYLERIASSSPGYKQSFFVQAFALQQLGRWNEAEPIYRRLVEQEPANAQAWFNLGHGLAEAGDCEAAKPMFERCLELKPSHEAARYWVERCG